MSKKKTQNSDGILAEIPENIVIIHENAGAATTMRSFPERSVRIRASLAPALVSISAIAGTWVWPHSSTK